MFVSVKEESNSSLMRFLERFWGSFLSCKCIICFEGGLKVRKKDKHAPEPSRDILFLLLQSSRHILSRALWLENSTKDPKTKNQNQNPKKKKKTPPPPKKKKESHPQTQTTFGAQKAWMCPKKLSHPTYIASFGRPCWYLKNEA